MSAVWNAEYGFYEAPEGATKETKEAIHRTLGTDDGLLQFGTTCAELSDREKIVQTLTGFPKKN